MKGLWRAVLFAVGVCLVAGCASYNDREVERILRSIEAAGIGAEPRAESSIDTARSPDTPLPPASPPARGTVTIQPGCQLRVDVMAETEREAVYVVDDNGAVNVDELGLVVLRNKTESEAAAAIIRLLESRGEAAPTARVEIVAASYDTIEIRGVVGRPGPVRIDPGGRISLNDALLRAGGVTADPRSATLRILRGGLTNAVSDLSQAETHGLMAADGRTVVPDIWLANNDVVYVFSGPTAAAVEVGEREILVLGEVPRPGVVRFDEAEPCTLLHLMLKIGGLTTYADGRAVRIHHRGPDGRETSLTVDVRPLLQDGRYSDDVPLYHGDRVVVPERRFALF